MNIVGAPPYPMNDTYRWNAAEGVIGVLGVAPAATADFYRRVTALIPARKDWEHVRVLIDSNPKLPSRGRHLELGEADPTPFMRAGIAGLASLGATIVAVPCNTAHILYDLYAASAPVPVPNMVELAVERLVEISAGPLQRVAVLGSRLTVAHDLYGRALRPRGSDCLEMSPWQGEVSALIELVKQGHVPEAENRWRSLIARCDAADAFVIACTELSSLSAPEWGERPVVDASDALARHCVAVAQGALVPSVAARNE
jgi:aspartate racemase